MTRFPTLLALAALLAATPAAQPDPAAPAAPVTLTLDDAIQIALERSYAIRIAALEVESSESQVRQAYGQLFPRVDLASSYTRNVVQANPFAGSSAGDIFSGLGALSWLAFNEQARTDDDPTTVPISLSAFNARVSEGQAAAGFMASENANPFGTDNAFQNAITISQPIFSGTAFAAVRGADELVDINRAALAQSRDETIDATRQAFYQALLAQKQAEVQAASLRRSSDTFDDAAVLVAQGVRPVLERLNAEVDLANAETGLVTAEAAAEAARDQLLLTLGLPVASELTLVGELAPPAAPLFQTVGLSAATAQALDLRPDVQQAALAVRLNEVQKSITKAELYPRLEAFANLSYSGNIPDDRSFLTTPDPADPFTFETGSTGFFSDAYWQPAVSVGLRLNWQLFDGFQTRRRIEQNQIAIDQAEIQLEQVRNAAALEVAAAVRQLASAERRLAAQTRTVETAETAFAFASARLEEGVASQVDVRISSQNLDLARLNYLQAVYDALVARSAYERATGTIEPAPLETAPPPAARPTVTAPASTVGDTDAPR